MIAEITAVAGLFAGLGGIGLATFEHRRANWYKLDAAFQRNIIADRDQIITNLQHKCAELAEEIDKWAAARKAVARVGGLARGLQQKRDKEARKAERDEIRDRTIGTLKATPLRPRAEVVAGARETRRGQCA